MLLGRANFDRRRYELAAESWQMIDVKERARRGLADPLAATVFLAAVQAMHEGLFEEAAEKFRSAGKLGNRDRRLGPLLVLVLFRAGQQAFYERAGRPARFEDSPSGLEKRA
jgi:hypothetical protein